MKVVSIIVALAALVTIAGVWWNAERGQPRLQSIGGAAEVRGVGSAVCATMGSSPVRCWGRSPTTIAGTSGLRSIAARGPSGFVCGVDPGSRVQCWKPGVSRYGSGRDKGRWTGDTKSRAVGILGAIESVSVGDGLVCGVRKGRATCVDESLEVVIPNEDLGFQARRDIRTLDVVSQTVGCAILDSGLLTCWGDANWPAPPEIEGVVSVSSAHQVRCAVKVNGTTWCAGAGSYGQLGTMTDSYRQWLRVGGVNDAVKVSTSGPTVCALRKTGAVVCWGDRGWGALGDGDLIRRNEPTPVPRPVVGIDDATAIDTYGLGACAVVARGFVKCWGVNSLGALGDGTLKDSAVPVDVRGL